MLVFDPRVMVLYDWCVSLSFPLLNFFVTSQLAKTWTQIGESTEEISGALEAERCHKKAVEYAEQTDDMKLQVSSCKHRRRQTPHL